jgi:hypothetical protein
LRLVAAALAVTGQIGFSSASLTLARDESSAAAHAEQSGVDLHHGHNEATCPACIALSLQAAPSHGAPLAPDGEQPAAATCRQIDGIVATPSILPNSCRAPPREA